MSSISDKVIINQPSADRVSLKEGPLDVLTASKVPSVSFLDIEKPLDSLTRAKSTVHEMLQHLEAIKHLVEKNEFEVINDKFRVISYGLQLCSVLAPAKFSKDNTLKRDEKLLKVLGQIDNEDISDAVKRAQNVHELKAAGTNNRDMYRYCGNEIVVLPENMKEHNTQRPITSNNLLEYLKNECAIVDTDAAYFLDEIDVKLFDGSTTKVVKTDELNDVNPWIAIKEI